MIKKSLFSLYGRFEIIYMLVMVIYMAQATPETGRMVGVLSGNPIPLLLPIVLTYFLCRKHAVSFRNRNLFLVLSIYIVWAICSLIKYNVFTTEELSYHFFMIYAIVIAYIHNQVFGYKLLPIYENIVVFFSKIAIFGWLIAVLVPVSASFFRLFPETIYGNHILYLFNWMDPAKGQIYSGLLRNAGPSWEPGRFAIMLTLAIFCNLCQNGVRFKRNKNIWWLLVALITTQSTTGFFATLILYAIFLIKKFNIKYVLVSVVIMLPLVYGMMQLDFMGEKITTKIFNAQNISQKNETFEWVASNHKDGEYVGSIDRFESMAFEWINVKNDPILGYSRNPEHSYFRMNISNNFVLANGLVKILGMYGIIFGIYFFYILFCSSIKIAQDSDVKRGVALFILFCISSISYQILSVPIFTTFWFYGFFTKSSNAILSTRKSAFSVAYNK